MTGQSNRFLNAARSVFLGSAILVGCTYPATAADDVAEFLAIPVDAIGAATANAHVARSHAGGSPFANPAAAWVESPTAELTHVEWFAKQSVDALHLRFPLAQGSSGLAITGRWVDHGDIPRFDASGARMSALEPRDLSLGVAYASRWRSLTWGVGGRYLQEDLDVARGTGYALDFGVQFEAGSLRAGLALTNALGQVSWEGESYEVPSRLAGGLTFRTWNQRIEADVQVSRHEFASARAVGLHWHALPNVLTLRAGYDLSHDAYTESFTPVRLGFGIAHQGIAVDYAFVPHDDLGQAHLVGLRWTGR